MSAYIRFSVVMVLALLSGCSALEHPPRADAAHALPAAAADFEKDRQAILGMLGEYHVRFDFSETVVLQEDYERRPRQESGGHELVLLVEDSGQRIVLQHLLLSQRTGTVIKHWRQDWHYEAGERLEFTADQVWRMQPIQQARVAGSWTQCVYEVHDAPRYCGTGRWNHRYGTPTWTSDRSWRPLPRREHTTRDDYNALNVQNRHTIVPGGWTHEQDNTKTIREGEKTTGTVAREHGFNDYRRIGDLDFTPARDYWRDTESYWQRVRAEWDRRIREHGGLRLDYPVDGMEMIMAVYRQSERARQGETVTDEEIRTLFDPWVVAP